MKALYLGMLFGVGLLALLGAWRLTPASKEVPQAGVPGPSDNAPCFTISFYPGASYIPGSVPYGMGAPVSALIDVIEEFEALYPDTRVEIVNVPSSVREYQVTQLSSGQAPDIMKVDVEDVWGDAHKGWYVPLDRFLEAPNEFVRAQGDSGAPGYDQWWDMFSHQALSRGKVGPDGHNYCITYDVVETGIFYNKTLFRAIGIEVPQTWDEFEDNLKAIQHYTSPEGARYIPLILNSSVFSDWALDLFFDQLYFDLLPGIDVSKADPQREAYLQGYLDWDEIVFLQGKGFFTREDPRYVAIWQQMHDLAQFASRDLSPQHDMMREFIAQQGVMFWSASPFVHRLESDPDLGFEWGVFYLPPFTRNTSPYASEVPMCVIGGSGVQYAVTESALKDTDASGTMAARMDASTRLNRVIALLHYITLPGPYERVVNEYTSFLPNIVGVSPRPSLQAFGEIAARRYATTKWNFTFDLRFCEIQRRMLELYLTDGIGLDEFLDEWQFPNLAMACQEMSRRRDPDLARLEAAWEELASQRSAMEGLPQ